jgi:hypothetical protein
MVAEALSRRQLTDLQPIVQQEVDDRAHQGRPT